MLTAVACLLVGLGAHDGPVRLHPDNPHYLEFRGRPTVLVSSGEHYGAVLNLDFDHAPYLDELKARGLNLTRTFSGTYFEVAGSFKIEKNTLAPGPGRYLGPWPRDAEGKYDLDRFEPAYFERLKSFLSMAAERGIVVEYVLFCPFYNADLWAVNAMNVRNNVNGIGDCPLEEVYTLKHPDLLQRQLAFVRRAVAELNAFDNLYFEICNEPYFGGVTLEWQARVAREIAETEAKLPKRHLIAQNIANGKAKVESPDPHVSIFNFHYASPPDTVGLNFGLNKILADDETGFKGTGDAFYRREAWEFLLSGGAIFSHLDYSFTTDHEDGTAVVRDPTPGGGGPTLRSQFGFLRRFLEGLDFIRMRPANEVIVGGAPPRVVPRVLAEPGKQYAIYLRDGGRATLMLDLPAGSYVGQWLDPRNGEVLKDVRLLSEGGKVEVESPEFAEDVTLRVKAG
jgi:hypothetical protein